MIALSSLVYIFLLSTRSATGVGIDYADPATEEDDYTQDGTDTIDSTVAAVTSRRSEASEHLKKLTDAKTVLSDKNADLDDNIITILRMKENIKLDNKAKLNLTTKSAIHSSLLISKLLTTTKRQNKVKTLINENYQEYDELPPSTSSTIPQKISNCRRKGQGQVKKKSGLRNLQLDAQLIQPVTQSLDRVKQLWNDELTTWFVPEDYPCWELPLLFGELGPEFSTSEVFMLRSSALVNVTIHKTPTKQEKQDVENHNLEKQTLVKKAKKTGKPELSANKWCNIPPCYGDHTLCLYRKRDYAQLCESRYKVVVPNMMEQMNIVNTVNSMRNRVATNQVKSYQHLPTAANMNQILYDLDLQRMAEAWLYQCLPGPAPCSALPNAYVSQLECTKYASRCCFSRQLSSSCSPLRECFVTQIAGCIHTWFEAAGNKLKTADIKCGHMTPSTYTTVQLLWAQTSLIGCAYGKYSNGNQRVICQFAPGAPFILNHKFFCGIFPHNHGTDSYVPPTDFTDLKFAKERTGVELIPVKSRKTKPKLHSHTSRLPYQRTTVRKSFGWGVDALIRIYPPGWASDLMHERSEEGNVNGSTGHIGRLVSRYSFEQEDEETCDSGVPVYVIGDPGSRCVETGRRYPALCYNFRDPTPGYRIVAVVAPVALFSLILYDLFGGVMRETNY